MVAEHLANVLDHLPHAGSAASISFPKKSSSPVHLRSPPGLELLQSQMVATIGGGNFHRWRLQASVFQVVEFIAMMGQPLPGNRTEHRFLHAHGSAHK